MREISTAARAVAADSVLRWPALDGVRGLAVLLVVFMHLHLVGVGWIGVQLFFVLSGFLITGILMRAAQAHSFADYLKTFYLRRALRIFPIFYLYLATLALACVLVPSLGVLRTELRYIALYLSNFFMATDAEPLAHPANILVAHLWSLCVEEHFYLFWPLLVYWLGRRHLRLMAVALIAAGPVIRYALGELWPSLPLSGLSADVPRVVYILTFSHWDAFATGALVSMYPTVAGKTKLSAALWALGALFAYGLGALVNGAGLSAGGERLSLGYPLNLPQHLQYVWGYSAINLLAGALLLLALNHRQVGAAFSASWLRFTGRISYGMYLLHMPLLFLMAQFLDRVHWPIGRMTAVVLLTPLYLLLLYGISALSFHYYERYFLELKDRLPILAKRESASASC